LSKPDTPLRQSMLGIRPVDERPDDALRHFATGPGRDGARPQEILTPPEVLEPLRALWGTIVFDAAGSRQHTIAENTSYTNGTSAPWPDRTYCNPPFKFLKDWMRHMMASQGRSCMLAPVRPHRRWFRQHAAVCQCMVWLDPLAFVGYEQKFPAPLCLLFLADELEHVRLLFSHLGEATPIPWSTYV
jgi:hypothetical protein